MVCEKVFTVSILKNRYKANNISSISSRVCTGFLCLSRARPFHLSGGVYGCKIIHTLFPY